MQAITGEKEGCNDEGACRGGGEGRFFFSRRAEFDVSFHNKQLHDDVKYFRDTLRCTLYSNEKPFPKRKRIDGGQTLSETDNLSNEMKLLIAVFK